MSEKTETDTDAAPGDEDENPELAAQFKAWQDADEEIAAGIGQPLTLRIAERKRDAAARQIADLVDDDVLDDSLIIDTWAEISRYGRAVGWSQEKIAAFLSGPKNLFPVPEKSDEEDEEEEEDEEDEGKKEEDEGKGKKEEEEEGKGGDSDAPPPPDAKFLKLRDKAE